MIKGSILPEVMNIINVYACNDREHGCLKQMLMDVNTEISSNMIIIWNINTLFSSWD